MRLEDNLQIGSVGEQVSLLQKWLGIEVTGVYSEDTEEAVADYQRTVGFISAHTPSGVVGPLTRATLNATFGPSQNRVAWVEGTYDSVFQWNGEQFVPFERTHLDEPDKKNIARIETWVLIGEESSHEGAVFSSNGNTFGVEGDRFFIKRDDIVARMSSTVPRGVWHHLAVDVGQSSVTFFVNDEKVETVSFSRVWVPWSFFNSLFSMFSLWNGDVVVNKTHTEKEISDEPNFLSKAIRFLSALFGGTPSAMTPTPPADDVSSGKDNFEEEAVVKTENPTVSEPSVPKKQKAPVAVIPPRAPNNDVSTSAPPVIPTLVVTATSTASSTLSDTLTSSTTALVASSSSSTTSSTDSVGTSTATLSEQTPDIGGGGGGGTASPVAQNQPPTITLLGSATLELETGSTYIDPGATASDPESGDLTPHLTQEGTVNTFLPNTYTITYRVLDEDGLEATQTRTVTVRAPTPLDPQAQEPSYTLAPVGETASIAISSGASDVKLTNAVISPLHVYVGDTQTLSVSVQSASPVSSVTATTQLDSQTITLTLEPIAEGSNTFTTSWVVFDTHVQTYRTTFTATNEAGQSGSVTLAWSDPCSGVTQGTNSSLSANCTVSVVDGLDGASLTIPANITLTLNSGATWAWNPGTSITVTGAIAINGTATLRKGYLFYLGSTDAAANTTTKYYFATTPQTGYVDVATYAQSSYYSQGYYQGYYTGGPLD